VPIWLFWGWEGVEGRARAREREREGEAMMMRGSSLALSLSLSFASPPPCFPLSLVLRLPRQPRRARSSRPQQRGRGLARRGRAPARPRGPAKDGKAAEEEKLPLLFSPLCVVLSLFHPLSLKRPDKDSLTSTASTPSSGPMTSISRSSVVMVKSLDAHERSARRRESLLFLFFSQPRSSLEERSPPPRARQPPWPCYASKGHAPALSRKDYDSNSHGSSRLGRKEKKRGGGRDFFEPQKHTTTNKRGPIPRAI
jgi:hypothetical protein